MEAMLGRLLHYQHDHAGRIVDALQRCGAGLDASDPGCHAAGTPILRYDGRIVPVEAVRVGDLLMGWDSAPCEVLSLCRGYEQMARIVPVKGAAFTVNLSHVLTLQYTGSASRHQSRGGEIIDITVRDYLRLPAAQRDALKLLRVAVDAWPERALPVDPYHLGVLLGDGCLKRGALSISKPGPEIEAVAREVAAAHGAEVVTRLRSPGNPTHRFRISGGLWSAVDGLGLGETRAHDKFIPHRYKTASSRQRAQILAGLLDTDGHLCGGGYDFISASRRLASDVAFLARSLGLAAYVKPSRKRCQTGAEGIYWRVSISGDCSRLPLRIPRKRAQARRQVKSVLRTGFRVEILPPDEYHGFTLIGDGRYCLGDFTVTHNTGKTFVAAAAAKRLGLKLAVVAPKAVLPAWERVAASFGVEVVGIHNYEAVRLGNTSLGRFRGKEFVWSLPPGAVLVFDECQRCKGRDTQNARLLIAARRQGIRILLLSATAATNPLEMRAIGFALGLHDLDNYWQWARGHGVVKGRFGMEFEGGPEDIERIHQRIFRDLKIGARMRIADIPDFPETQIIAEPVGTGREVEIQAVYDQLKIDLNRALATDDTAKQEEIAAELDARAPSHLTIMLRARQQIEALKVPAIVAMAQDGVAEGMSVAVFVNFDEPLREVAKRCGTDCVIHGGQNPADREEAIRRFQSNEVDVIVCNIRAGGVGVSLHDPTGEKPRLALISPTFSAQDLRQALGRVHRAGGGHSLQKIIFAAGTVEEQACAAVEAKLACIDTLNDGDLQAFESPAMNHTTNTETKAEAPAHAKHSPSALACKEICPGFESNKESGPAAEEGTRLHKALETGNTDGLDDEQRQVVEMCHGYLEDLENEARGEGERELEVWREAKLSICGGLTFGTLDYALFNRRLARADLVDFKMGRRAVPDAEVNPQVQAYVLGLFEAFPGIESITAHVLLPRRDEVSTATYSRADVPRLRLRISTIVARCECTEPELRPTDNCLWCARQATCPALHRHALTIAAGYGEELQIPEEFHPGQITDPAVMARALTVSRVLEKWCDSVRHHAVQMRLGGQEIPGHELRSRAGVRKITDAVAAWAAVRERISPDRFAACCDVSISRLEAAFAEEAPRGAKTKAKQELSEALADLGIVETGKESFYLAKTKH